MKFKILGLFFGATLIALNLASPTNSLAVEYIESFNSDIIINSDSSISVTETIKYDFGTAQRHGIFRDIPYKEKIGNKTFNAEIAVQSVTDENGKPYIYATSKETGFNNIKIGNPNATINGQHTYVIKYIYRGAIKTFDNKDELFWDVTGNDWPVGIRTSAVTVRFSEDLISDGILFEDSICYTGVEGSREQDCVTQIKNNQVIGGTPMLGPTEGFTIAAKFPTGYLTPYQLKEDRTGFYIWLGILYLLVINFLSLLAIPIFWRHVNSYYSPDFHKRRIVRMYDPPLDTNGKWLTPMQVFSIFRLGSETSSITGEIIDLAVKKYVVIEEKPKEEWFGKKEILLKRGKAFETDPELTKLKKHERDILNILKLDKLDSISTTALGNVALELITLAKTVHEDLLNEGFLDPEYKERTARYSRYSVIAFCIGSIVGGFAISIISGLDPKLSKKGEDALLHMKGLKEFLLSQDEQLEFQEKNYYFFEKLLPYAIAMGVADIWAKKFAHITDVNPEWYVSSNSITNTNILINSLNKDFAIMQTAYTPKSSSSSSGFSSGGSSGGGSGGGGGGSW